MKRKFRLLKNQDFKNVLDQKQNVSRGNYTIYYSKNELSHVRVGISVSSKLGNSVVRHKIKRQVTNVLDKCVPLDCGIDLVVIVRKKYTEKSYADNVIWFRINKFRL